uniref:Uncharacterized protein n=1 Tax=Eptatretus burgeri TaxID=7764 RepID=A0A8C4R7D1_EPTBU
MDTQKDMDLPASCSLAETSKPGQRRDAVRRTRRHETRSEEPGASERRSEEPGASERRSEEPGTSETQSEEPGASERRSEEPGASETQSEEPGASERRSEEPGASETQSEEPGASETRSEEPGASETRSEEPGLSLPSLNPDPAINCHHGVLYVGQYINVCAIYCNDIKLVPPLVVNGCQKSQRIF